MKIRTLWRFKIRSPDRILMDSGVSSNLNTMEGALFLLDSYYFPGAGYTAQWFIGLAIGAMTPDVADTAARITAGAPNPPTTNNWQEFTQYTETARQAVAWGAAGPVVGDGSIDNSLSPCVFTPTVSGLLSGGFLVTASGKGATLGKLYAVDSNAGGLAFNSGDSILVTVSTDLEQSPT